MTDKEILELLERDYDKKIEQLHRHLLSIWTRFNFFISFEGLIIASKFLSKDIVRQDLDSYSGGICFLGLFSSLIWYCFSANDRYLVKIYRTHVEDAFNKILTFLKDNDQKAYGYFSADFDMSTHSKQKITSNFWGWRYSKLGLTDYATMVPVVVMVFWTIFILLDPLIYLWNLITFC